VVQGVVRREIDRKVWSETSKWVEIGLVNDH
jgi:hypothetical protein